MAIADTILAPFTPSNTARSGGTIYPVIRNLPPLYDSKPNDPSMRRMGSYIMWVAIAATCVTSTMFLTALAPNLLAVELVRKPRRSSSPGSTGSCVAPGGNLAAGGGAVAGLLALSAGSQGRCGGLGLGGEGAGEDGRLHARKRLPLAVLVVIALVMWIFRGDEVNATTAALIVISLMLLTNVVTWDDITKNFAAWNTLAWFATLVALADGLSQVGFVKWFAEVVATHMSRLYAGEGNR